MQANQPGRIHSLGAFLMATAVTLQWNVVGAAEPGGELEVLEQIQVYGTQQNITALRQAVVDAEDRFYDRYNELNVQDEFDVKCRVEARTGTRLNTRTCRPLYQEEAVREGAKEGIEIRQRFQSIGGGALLSSPPVPAAIAIQARRQEFEQRMRTVVLESAELAALLEQRAAAAQALEAASRRGGAETPATPSPGESSGVVDK